MLKQKSLPVALLIFGLAHGSSVGVSRAADASSTAANIQSLSLAVSPLIPRAAQGEHNSLLASIDSARPAKVTLTLSAPGWPQPVTKSLPSLAKGKQTVEIEVAPLTSPTPITVRVESDELSREFGPFTVAPPRNGQSI